MNKLMNSFVQRAMIKDELPDGSYISFIFDKPQLFYPCSLFIPKYYITTNVLGIHIKPNLKTC